MIDDKRGKKMILDRYVMKDWVVEALKELGGSATILAISKVVWARHGEEIKNSGDAFYTWQYEIRWAGDILRKEGVLKPVRESPRHQWELAKY
jgi:hypothetical protein